MINTRYLVRVKVSGTTMANPLDKMGNVYIGSIMLYPTTTSYYSTYLTNYHCQKSYFIYVGS